MTLLAARGLCHGAGTRLLFADVSLAVARGQRIGLAGFNGAGKSTLLGLLAGLEPPDAGDVVVQRGARVALVEQFLPEGLAALPLADAVAAPRRVRGGDAPTTRGDEPAVPERHHSERVLADLEFTRAERLHRVGDLSGGQSNRLMLARALVSEPDVILFDEPSNHLDLVTLQLLERLFVERLRAAYVLVSHDRALLDAVTTTTLMLRDGRLLRFELPFSAARRELAEQDVAAAATRKMEERRIDELRAAAKRLAVWGRIHDSEKLAKRAKNMEKRVARLEAQRTFVSDGPSLSLRLDTVETRANRVLRVAAHDVVAPDGGVLLHIDELIIRPGERVALLGRNGCGKSTLLRSLVAHFRTAREQLGPIAFSPQAVLGYYDQELDEVALDATLAGYLRTHGEAGEPAIRLALIRAGFEYRDHERRVLGLSGGERARLLFVRLELQRPNFLILDEPTNHLDIEGKEALTQQLMTSRATLLLTAHDRRFVDEVANRFVAVEGGRLTELPEPEAFYAGLRHERDTPPPAPRLPVPAPSLPAQEWRGQTPALEPEEALTLLVELEARLAADLARKSRFQKPLQQQQWRAAIARLKGLL